MQVQRNTTCKAQTPNSGGKKTPKNVNDSYDTDDPDASGSFDDYQYPDLELSLDDSDIASQWPRKPLNAMKWQEKCEYVFVRVTLVAAGSFALLGVIASLMLSGLLFAMGMKEVAIQAVEAFIQNNAVGLVSAAVGALDRFLLGMVCLVFGLGSFELFLARSNREGEVRDRRLKKLAWLRVSSIDDLEQKVGEIIVAVMVVNLLEMSLHMTYSSPVGVFPLNTFRLPDCPYTRLTLSFLSYRWTWCTPRSPRFSPRAPSQCCTGPP
jgi:uncharacterized membrane protein YqhA